MPDGLDWVQVPAGVVSCPCGKHVKVYIDHTHTTYIILKFRGPGICKTLALVRIGLTHQLDPHMYAADMCSTVVLLSAVHTGQQCM
jgi:hypothetical protein